MLRHSGRPSILMGTTSPLWIRRLPTGNVLPHGNVKVVLGANAAQSLIPFHEYIVASKDNH